MSVSNKAYWKNKLITFIDRLEELKVDDKVLQGWPEPGLSKLKVLKDTLNITIDRIIEFYQQNYLDKINQWLDLRYLENRVRQLFEFTNFLRKYSELLFSPFTFELAYLFSFIEDLLGTFPPKTRLGRGETFTLIPTGTFSTLPFSDWLTMGLRKVGISERQESEIYCFECVSKLRLDRSAVLFHELIHVLIYKNQALINSCLTEMMNNENISSLFNSLSHLTPPIDSCSHLKEYFCDFASAWHLGPIYAKAFLDEIEYYPKGITYSHPPAGFRAKLIIETLNRETPKSIRDFYGKEKERLAQRLGVNMDVIERGLMEISHKYASILTLQFRIIKLKMRKVPPKKVILKYIEHNLPFIYEDIRLFLNGLPDLKNIKETLAKRELDAKQIDNYFIEFLQESVLRSNAFRIFRSGAEKLHFGVKLPLPYAFSDG
jgi:hypothetical protein